ncbi:hypothetical protein BGZ68_004318 [Mortierella alpina]|nr:hypothetical protein BGZ68_004318 [Mortierella alpina]
MRGHKVEKCYSRKELNNRAKAEVVDQTPIRFYIRSAEHLYKQARTSLFLSAEIYQEEGDVQTSYILYMRFCNLVVYELKKHPEYSNPDYKVALAALKKRAMDAMDMIGKLNPILDQKYEEYQEYIRQREEILSAQAQAQAQDAQLQQEIQLQHQRHHQQQQRHQRDDDWKAQDHQGLQFTNNLPVQGWSLAKAFNTRSTIAFIIITIRIGNPTSTGPPPALPRKPVSVANAPKLPPKVQMEEDIHEFSQGLRTMIVPVRLLDRFLNIVRPNTIKKLETCGILAGVLSRNKLTVTTLIIPKQTATSDTCSTTNEDELFEFQSERDLMTLGWIHTHPTQTCFMSSVDLHTHCSYQLMLPEAIAIVCAPSHEKDYGVFRLTDPPGLQVITNCRQKPLFHQHPGENDIYTDACDQGHVELKDLDLEIVDLRKK